MAEKLPISIMARAVLPQIKLSKYFIDYGDCPLNESRTSILTMKNLN